MPRFLTPKHSTPHRVAAIALYRALLSRCTSVPLPDERRSSLRNAIRNKFRRNRKLNSPYLLGLSFRAGYETLDHLDAASAGDLSSGDFLAYFLSTLPPALKRDPPKKPPSPRPYPSKQALACLPPEKAVLNVRPYETVSGPRHVPILCSANGIPFLRIKKPQPMALSRILRQKTNHQQKVFDQKVLLENYWLPIAEQEDNWDELVRVAGLDENDVSETPDSVSWVDEIEQAQAKNVQVHKRDLHKDRELSRKMLRIVDEETKLALAEGQKVIRGRKGRPKTKKMTS